MTPRIRAAIAIAMLAAPRWVSEVVAADWPLIRGDAKATGAVAEAMPQPFDIVWTYAAEGSGFEATASIVGGIVYVGDVDGTFHAIKLSDGKSVWTKKFEETGFVAGSAVVDGHIYCVDYNGIVRCLNVADGQEVWKFDTETSLYAAPNVHEGIVLIAAESGQLFALDAKTGEKKWEPFTIDQPLRCWPTVVEGRVLVAGCDGLLHLVDVATGNDLESIDIGGPADGMPAVVGDRVYFCTAGGVFHAMTIKPLAAAWEYSHRGQGEDIHAAAATEKIVVLGTHDKRVVVRALLTSIVERVPFGDEETPMVKIQLRDARERQLAVFCRDALPEERFTTFAQRGRLPFADVEYQHAPGPKCCRELDEHRAAIVVVDEIVQHASAQNRVVVPRRECEDVSDVEGDGDRTVASRAARHGDEVRGRIDAVHPVAATSELNRVPTGSAPGVQEVSSWVDPPFDQPARNRIAFFCNGTIDD